MSVGTQPRNGFKRVEPAKRHRARLRSGAPSSARRGVSEQRDVTALPIMGREFEALRQKAERPVVFPLNRDECLALVEVAQAAKAAESCPYGTQCHHGRRVKRALARLAEVAE